MNAYIFTIRLRDKNIRKSQSLFIEIERQKARWSNVQRSTRQRTSQIYYKIHFVQLLCLRRMKKRKRQEKKKSRNKHSRSQCNNLVWRLFFVFSVGRDLSSQEMSFFINHKLCIILLSMKSTLKESTQIDRRFSSRSRNLLNSSHELQKQQFLRTTSNRSFISRIIIRESFYKWYHHLLSNLDRTRQSLEANIHYINSQWNIR
jgi:hypothetical protein